MAVAGKVACTPKGEWATGTSYEIIDIVTHNNASWMSRVANNTEEPSETAENWILLVKDGEDGTNGTNGTDGTDGFSPTVTTEKTGKVTTVTITDAIGPHAFDVRDGEDGDGSGDMLKSTYDKDSDGVVDKADQVEWKGVLNVPYDATPTEDSEKLMKSKDIKTALDGKGDTLVYDEEESKLRMYSGGADGTLLSEVTIEGGGGALKIGDVSGATISSHMAEVSLKWSDPSDIIVDGTPLATWGGTLVVRKAGSAPASRSDGTVIVDSTTRDQYASAAFTDNSVEYGTTYYYRFFPYTTTGSYTTGTALSATPERVVIENVPVQSGSLTYDGTEQTADFSYYDTDKMTATGVTGTNAGSYTATFTPKEGYCWSNGETTGREVTWTIGNAVISAIPSVSAPLIWTGSELTPTWSGYDPDKLTIGGDTAGTDTGTYTATFTPKTNYEWWDGTTETKPAQWAIVLTVIENTPVQNGSLTYDGTAQAPTWLYYDETKMTKTETAETDAGDYSTTFTPLSGFCWSDGSVAGKPITWSIGKAAVTIPTVNESVTITYTGNEQAGSFNDYVPSKMNVTGNRATDAGTHTAVFSLSNSNNYVWAGGSEADQSVDWRIEKADGVITPQSASVTLNHTNPTATIGFSQTGDGTVSVQSSDTSVATAQLSGSRQVLISSVDETSGSATITLSATETTNYKEASAEITVTAEFSVGTIYGVEWDGTSATTLSRTDAAANFTDPVPQHADGNGGWTEGSSPFDEIQPWAGMVKSERAGGTMVAIPKFYFKLTKSGSVMKLQISPEEQEGFSVSPAHRDRGDGAGERDVIYVGRYHCSSVDYKSTTGVTPMVNITRDEARQAISNLGATIWQNDYATRLTIQMLYLVEFADWNSQAKIGGGCSLTTASSSAVYNMGYTDTMTYHTGTVSESIGQTVYGGTQYRNIEGLWDNCFDWCDGIYFAGADIYAIMNPANFSDTEGGTKVGERPTTGNYIKAYDISDVEGFDWFFYPSEVGGTDSTYVCDYCYYNASGVVLYVGGSYSQDQDRGLFFLYGSSAATNKSAYRGSRLLELPSAA